MNGGIQLFVENQDIVMDKLKVLQAMANYEIHIEIEESTPPQSSPDEVQYIYHLICKNMLN